MIDLTRPIIARKMNQTLWEQWLQSCPLALQEVCRQYPPDRLYYCCTTGHRVIIVSYEGDYSGRWCHPMDRFVTVKPLLGYNTGKHTPSVQIMKEEYPALVRSLKPCYHEQVSSDNYTTPVDTYSDRYTSDGKQTPEYTAWLKMRANCNNPKSAGYKKYGARGVTICDRWQESFENFFDDMGKRPEGCKLGMVDPNGDYTPENCKWG